MIHTTGFLQNKWRHINPDRAEMGAASDPGCLSDLSVPGGIAATQTPEYLPNVSLQSM